MRALVPLAALIFVGGGCKAPPTVQLERVFVDLSPALVSQPQLVMTLPGGRLQADSGTLAGTPANRMYAGRAINEVRAAEESLRQARARGFSQLTEEVQRTFRRRAERQYESEIGRLDAQRDEINRDTLSEIRNEFDRHAEARTPILYDLSKIAGYPAETRKSQRFQRTRELLFPKLNEQIDALRTELLREDAAYLANRARILAQSKLELEEAEQAMANRRQTLIDNSEALARAFLARSLKESNSAALDAADLLEVNEVVPATPAARVNLRAIAAPPVVVPDPRPKLSLKQAEVERLAKIWATTQHKVLVPQTSGVRNATIEFKEWLKTYQVGP